MYGLYHRALEVYQQGKQLRLVPKTSRSTDIDAIPSDERESILREIDNLLERNRIAPETTRSKSGKSGLALPLLVNLLCLVTVAIAVVLFTTASRGEETRLIAESRELSGAENQLVEALRRESSAQLNLKDQAILSFQAKLTEATAERERLQQQTKVDIQRREDELAQELAATLTAERAKLREAGLDSESLEISLRQLESQLQAESSMQLEAFQTQALEAAAKHEAAIDVLVTEYQHSLSQAQSDRTLLQLQYTTRETELRQQFASETELIRQERAQALAALQLAEEQQLQESLVEGRILASYDSISSRIASGAYPAALENIAQLREALDSEPARSMEAIKRRRAVELFMLTSLEELIRNRMERDSASAAALLETKIRIEAARDKAALADAAFERQDYINAKQLYTASLEEIPELRLGHDRLLAMALNERETNLATTYKAALEAEGAARQAAETTMLQERHLSQERLAALEAYLTAEYSAQLTAERTTRLVAEARATQEIQLAAEYYQALENKLKADHAQALENERTARLAAEEAALLELQLSADRFSALEAKLRFDHAAELAIERTARLALEEDKAHELQLAADRLAALEAKLKADHALEAEQTARLNRLQAAGGQALSDGNSLMSQGAWEAALERYRQALSFLLEDAQAASTVIDQAALAGYQSGSAKDRTLQAALPERIAQTRQALEATVSTTSRQEPDIASLLRAKLLLIYLLQNDPIKSEYPELYGSMETYFDSFASQQRQAGREAALQELLVLMEATLDGSNRLVIGGTAAKPASEDLMTTNGLMTSESTDSERLLVSRLLGVLENTLRRQTAVNIVP